MTLEDVLDDAVASAAEATRGAVPTGDDAFAERVMHAAALPRGDYERARVELARELGIRVTALDGFVKAARQASGEEQARASQRDELVAIALEGGELWRDEAEDGFATVRAGGRREHYRVRSSGFRKWLSRGYGDRNRVRGPSGDIVRAPGSQALTEAIAAIEANAARGPLGFPRLRVGGSVKETVLLDLGGPDWRGVVVTRDGWEVVDEPPAQFLRAPGMLPLPEPVRGDGAAKLRRHLDLPEAEHRLVVGWLAGAFRPKGPYPILAVHGEQGSGKSTLVRMLRRLVDPNRAGDRSRPKDERDLVIAASNSWLVCFDNLSRLDEDLSDAMCRVATGSGFGTRTLYADDAETLFQVCRPQMVNGIPDLARSGDLVDRCITVMLGNREEGRNAYEDDLWPRFEADIPEMLGHLLDAVSCAIRRLGEVRLAERPRLADFARWVEAAAPALGWGAGAFLGDYLENRRDGATSLVEGDPLAALIARVVGILTEPFEGTATELLSLVQGHATDEERKAPGWPKNARALSGRLRRLAPALRKTGVAIAMGRGEGRRSVRLERDARFASFASGASSPSRANGLGRDANPGLASSPSRFASAEPALRQPGAGKPAGLDGNDANDAKPPAPSKSPARVVFPPVGRPRFGAAAPVMEGEL